MAVLNTFIATNGDYIRVGRTGNLEYSTNSGSSWTTIPYPTYSGYPYVGLRAMCASTTASNTFYLRLGASNEYVLGASQIDLGAIGVWNTSTRTMSWTQSTTNTGTLPTYIYADRVYGEINPRYAMYHDGTNVYFLMSYFSSYDSFFGTHTMTNRLEVHAASTFGSVAASISTIGTSSVNNGTNSQTPNGVWSSSLFMGTSSAGKLFVTSPRIVPRTGGQQTDLIQYTVSGTSLTQFSTATLTSGETPRYAQDPSSKTVYIFGSNRTWTFGTSLGSAISTSGGSPMVAFIAKTTGGPVRYVTAERSRTTFTFRESPDGLNWISVGSFTPAPPPTTATFYDVWTPVQARGSLTPALSTPYAPFTASFDWTYNYVEYLELYSTVIGFNVLPTATQVSPINGTQTFDQTTDRIDLTWTYSDADGTTQNAYEVLVAESKAAASSYYLVSNGTLSASEQTVSSALNSAYIAPNVLAASAYGYQWSLRVRDEDSEWSAWTGWNTFKVSGRPTVSITAPAASARFPTVSNRVTVTYTYTDPESTALQSSRATLYDANGTTLWDETLYLGNASIASGGSYSHLINYDLGDGLYSVGIRAQDATGIWSNEQRISFSTAMPAATDPTWSITSDTDGVVTITVTDPNSIPFTSATLYRWSSRLNRYVSLGAQPASTFTYIDRYAPMSGAFTYKVELVGDRGMRTYVSPSVDCGIAGWRIATPTRMLTIYPESHQFSSLVQEEYLEPLGRSRQVRSYLGTRGYEGQLAFEVLDSERDALVAALEGVVSDDADTYVKTPLGTTYKVAMKTPAVAYKVGGRASVTVDLTEVGDA